MREVIESDVNNDLSPKPPPKPRPSHPASAWVRHVIAKENRLRQSLIAKYGPGAALGPRRRFSLALGRVFMDRVLPCPRCLNCDERLEGDQRGDGKRFCTDCIRFGRDDVYREQMTRAYMRAHFNLQPGQRLSKKREDQFWLDFIYDHTISIREIEYGTHHQEEAQASS